MVQVIHRYTGEVLLEVDRLQGADLCGANLKGADLYGANLEGANLYGADLRRADLRWTYLQGANLYGADLKGADLCGDNLQGANLRKADLQGANLYGADLQGAYLQGANLQGANLEGANLEGATLPHFSIVPEEGGFYAWKKTSRGVIKIYVPADAKRCNSLVSRKCRASKIKVISGDGIGGCSPNITRRALTYNKGATVEADEWDDDIRVECTHGIHFFMTKKEAEQW